MRATHLPDRVVTRMDDYRPAQTVTARLRRARAESLADLLTEHGVTTASLMLAIAPEGRRAAEALCTVDPGDLHPDDTWRYAATILDERRAR